MSNKGIKNNSLVAQTGLTVALEGMAFAFNHFEKFRKYLRCGKDGWINFSVGLQTEDGKVAESIAFENGNAKVYHGVKNPTCCFHLMDEETLLSMASLPPNELLNLLIKNKMTTTGNLIFIAYFDFLISVLLKDKQISQMKQQKKDLTEIPKEYQPTDENADAPRRKKEYIKSEQNDPGVKYLPEQYLSEYSIEDFPRLQKFLDIHFNEAPAICCERPYLLTKWFKENGFETDNNGKPWNPELRQANAFKYLMENRKPIIRKDDLLAGTSTTKEIGVLLYPDTTAPYLWGELLTVDNRPLNPYKITDEDVDLLNSEILPFWVHRNIREWVREQYDSPLCQQLDERFAVTFQWKTVACSHTVIDNKKYLELGCAGVIEEAKAELEKTPEENKEKRETLESMILCYEGIIAYAKHLSLEAKHEATVECNAKRRLELQKLAEICDKVPENPSETLDEAVNAIWILWISVHMENTNAGFSIGRMDQYLQPYFEADIKKCKTDKEKNDYIKHAIELIGCFYMRCTDHIPTMPDIANHLFGGSSANQAITLGGVTPEGEDAVNDMTYIFLKVTEMLGIRDPNINTRFNNEKNTPAFLKRLCEVNVNTCGTPAIHNDEMIMQSLNEFNYPIEELRDWSATGCVEPTISGKHIGHTNCMMFNMVAALEMALNNGYHPLMRWHLGPKTGSPSSFKTFDDFFNAFCTQIAFLANLACEYNNKLGEAHSVIRPTPMMSALVDGCMQKGKDVTLGGAKYNSSGIAGIGLADVTDSLLVIKKLVFENKEISLTQMCNAVKCNFEGYEVLRSKVLNSVDLFGSNSDEAVEMANRVTKFMHDCFAEKRNFRGGHYTVGFWSMSNHVAFGTMTGALPSGRLAGKPFTPGLTPEAHASKSLLDNIKDVAKLDSDNLTNNITFNVKVVPSSSDTHEEIVNHLYGYAKAYCDLGGMQMQFNVVSSETMKAAMVNPDAYRDLLVRISGYNAYFVTLDRDLQLELIERAEYGI